ncbi:unnamed protein product [Bursaphelenchus okinawaensis]|uniref:Carboxylic ester hydrolase n=1 Tax=Bursaphelenchus okinawaensis TaxID=465554 RepID=A0A811L7K5_9BILA|nr:unnamed protein product [Bursaphelenchus okinawaensis]CAG9117274.1 unnamed protein product [Bursaphelenchus okinawaensis]
MTISILQLTFLLTSLVQHILCFDVGTDVDKAKKVDVLLSTGWIRGYEFESKHGTANVFKRVPYIAPPVGPNRFQAPHPVQSWDGVIDATQYSLACPQNSTDIDEHTWEAVKDQSEDCVYMNIFADNQCSTSNPCPVIFYLHGGGTIDDPRMFNDSLIIQNFASQSVIFLLPSFRQGILGWLDIGEPTYDAPYNAALLDIIAALRWTQREIASFGGNPREIVLFGHSSGGHLASLLMSSPAIEPKAFSRALIMSPGGRYNERFNRPRSMYVAEKVGCLRDPNMNIYNMSERLACLRTKPFRELIDTTAAVSSDTLLKQSGPQFDAYTVDQRVIHDVVKNWKPIPILFSVMSFEGDFDSPNRDKDVCFAYAPFVCPGREADCDIKCQAKFSGGHPIPIGGSFMHAITWAYAQINNLRGGTSYYHVLDQYHADVHADDLVFAIGLHAENRFHARNVGHQIQKRFLPRLLLRWIKNESLVYDWKPMDHHGRNYFYNNIKAIGNPNNYTIVARPHSVRGRIFHQEAVDFWWKELAQLNDDFTYITNGNDDKKDDTVPSLTAVNITTEKSTEWYVMFILIVITSVLTLTLFVIIAVVFVWKRSERKVGSGNNDRVPVNNMNGTEPTVKIEDA